MVETVKLEVEDRLSEWLADATHEGQIVQTKLKASERVIARVTDGIYRQPASALRELISNAWDADATSVTILTDAPRFSRIYVRDNGNGMNHATLSRLLKNIGGSAKRREDGISLGIANNEDPDKTPKGRPLIGKIGIGLFSISQLSRRFQIITKVKGEPYRLLAEIKLRAYSEEGENELEADNSDDYITGDVFIRREHSDDLDAHGTDIILDDVKPMVRDILRSAERWKAVEERGQALENGDIDTYLSMRVEAPSYHSGYIEKLGDPFDHPIVHTVSPKLPWSTKDPAEVRMSKLMEAVEGEFSRLDRPELANTLDTYLEMIWSLGLSAPVAYVDKHPFDLTAEDNLQLYWLTKERGRGQPIPLEGGQTVREAVKAHVAGAPELTAGIDPVGQFNVTIDGVLLKRPIRFKHHKADVRSLNNAVMFVGHFQPDLSRFPTTMRGGELAVDAYLFWTGRVIPKENNGVLVRIRGASGANFDQTFFKYQVSEQTRLRQITSELFVEKGLDAALNIDRESFNFAHPHLQMVTLWLHGAIRQLTNRLKEEGSKLRAARSEAEAIINQSALNRRAEAIWHERKGSYPPPDIAITRTPHEARTARESGSLAVLIPNSTNTKNGQENRISTVSALMQVLAAFDVLEGRSYEEQQQLIDAIISIFSEA